MKKADDTRAHRPLLVETLAIGWAFLTQPRSTTARLLASPRAKGMVWTILLVSLSLWTAVTLYMNVAKGQSARGREVMLGVDLGPDEIVSLGTIPLGLGVIALAALSVSRVLTKLGGTGRFFPSFAVLAFCLNVPSLYFDFPHEVAWIFTTEPWELIQIYPNFYIWANIVMFVPVLWALIIATRALAQVHGVSLKKAALGLAITVLPFFLVLLFIVG